MTISNFVVSECGNGAKDAWERAQSIASLENQAEPQSNVGVLHKDGFKVVGTIDEKASTVEANKAAHNVLKHHTEATIENKNALCLDAGGGEYYFMGKVELDK